MGAPPNAAAPPAGYQSPPPSGFPQPVQPWNPTPAPAPRPMNWDMFAFVTRFIGFTLIFVGVLVEVVLATPGSSLFDNPSASDLSHFAQSYANGLMAGKILLVLGGFILGLGAGIKLHWVLKAPAGGSSEAWGWTIVERFFNYAILAGSIWLMVWITTGYALVFPHA